MKITPLISLVFIAGSNVVSGASFMPKSQALFSIRGGSDESGEDISATVETSVIENPVAVEEAVVPTEVAAPQEPKKAVNPKLANAIERTGPALAMLGAVYMLLKYTGEKGLLYFLIPVMQFGMYGETTGIIEDYHQRESRDMEVKLEKWWWFATVFASTTLRNLGGVGKLTGSVLDLACFGMVSIGLVLVVTGMASHQSAGAEMFRKYLGEISAFHFALIFLIGQSSFWIKTIQSFGMEWVIYPALLVVVNDTMAYVFGVLMGKHKLLPRLSPKKTVEGFVGAGFSTCAIAVPLLKLFVKNFAAGGKAASVMEGNNLIKHALVLGLYTSLISPFGGFLASAVKRAHGAKDFGTLIPGHGGVVDRFDCQVVTAPFVFLYLKSCLKDSPILETVVEAVEQVMSGDSDVIDLD